jgi:hypothetical protein
MEVKIFQSATSYQSWIDHIDRPVKIIDITVFNDELIVTYK